jgi:hypothetical protein
MRDEKVTAWITKYALTKGVFQVVGEASGVCPGMLVYQSLESIYDQYARKEGKDWHRTREAAVERAEAMRKSKIASLKKRIAALEKIRFETTEATGAEE